MQARISYFAPIALLPNGWANDVLITVDAAGWIADLQSDQTCGEAIALKGPVLPGMQNLHSHSFQRAIAGMTEHTLSEKDNFWTWRDTMYTFLQKLTPEDLQVIAAQLYMEMLKAGFTTVGEFHYLHHQPDGHPYLDRALSSHHIIMAAKETGIAITHIPVLYAYSGFGKQTPTAGQKRFINNESQILDIMSSLVTAYKKDAQITIGFAFHSLRAISPEMLKHIMPVLNDMHPAVPIHIHIAEQMKEVNDCIAWCGHRPVEWLLNNVEVNKKWCLVHATHMTAAETYDLAHSGAVAGLCPTTEGNLGDGFFNLETYLNEDGCWGIGSDSHISISFIEELRWLEYGQRLLHQKRNIVNMPGLSSVGASLYRLALSGGAQALGRAAGRLEVGKRADFIALDPDSPTLLNKKHDFILDALIFAGNINPIRHVVVGGRQVVKDFKHVLEDKISTDYKKTLSKFYKD